MEVHKPLPARLRKAFAEEVHSGKAPPCFPTGPPNVRPREPTLRRPEIPVSPKEQTLARTFGHPATTSALFSKAHSKHPSRADGSQEGRLCK
uniref:Uncharacterized protein n=1 Tax=Trichuris muris TaxID=70415 RepID=A0A5S6Q6V9_TRIMR